MMLIRSAIAAACLAVGAASFVISCAGKSQSTAVAESPATTRPTVAQLATTIPSLATTRPVDLPGLHNVVAYADDIWSGSVPEGEAGFASLAAMGVKTILTVDGAEPDLEGAGKYGIRYVHLPISYGGMETTRTLEIARVVDELPKPMYIHCHHGKHRSAAAAAAALVTLGKMTNAEGEARMKVSGTAANYTGLYECVAIASVISADDRKKVDGSFPQVWKTTGMVQAMVHIDEANDHLKAIEKAGWKAPADHPDLVPAAEAGRLADGLRLLVDDHDTAQRPPEFADWMKRDAQMAQALEDGIVTGNWTNEQKSKQFAAIGQSCKACHTKYRD